MTGARLYSDHAASIGCQRAEIEGPKTPIAPPGV